MGPDIKYNNSVSVIIAARNEESVIARTLQNLQLQPGIAEIIVVDDHSIDKTLEVVLQIAQNNPKIKLVQAPSLPEGWIGKSHALHIGSQKASSEFILFTDADVMFADDIIQRIVIKMQKEDFDHIGGLFGLDCYTVAEKISGPVLSSFGRISLRLTAKRLGAGTGAFNLVKKSTYLAAGGHFAIKDKIVDDVELSRLMRKHTAKTLFLPETSKYVRVRLFDGWRGYWNAIARSAIPFLGGHILFSIILSLPFLLLATLLCLTPLFGILNIWFIIPYILFYLLVYINKSYCDTNGFWVLFYPIPFFIMGSCLLFTAFRLILKPEISWRGRKYNIAN